MWKNDWKYYNSFRERSGDRIQRSAARTDYNFHLVDADSMAIDSNSAEDNVEGSYWQNFDEVGELGNNEQRAQPTPFYCTLCSLELSNEKAYQSHLQSLVHGKKQMEADLVKKGTAKANSETPQDYGNDREQFYCEACNHTMKSRQAYDSHCKGFQHSQNVSKQPGLRANTSRLQGLESNQTGQRAQIMQMFDKIGEPLVGLEYITEVYPEDRRLEPYYTCSACDCRCNAGSIYAHVVGVKHCLHFLKTFYPDYYTVLRHHQGQGRKSDLKAAIEHYVQLAYLETGRSEVSTVNKTEQTSKLPLSKVKAATLQSDALASEQGDCEMPSSSTMKSNVKLLLQSLAEIEVTNEEEASLAFQISNTLTKALIKYRKTTLSSDVAEQEHLSFSNLEDM